MKQIQDQVKILISLFWSFFKIGPSTFGGGYAMIPVIEREVVTKRKWISDDELGDVLSVAGSAPGGIGVNSAAFIGYRLAGIMGSLIAIIAITLPTFIIVTLLAVFLTKFNHLPVIAAAFMGIRGAIIALILVAAYRMGKTAIMDKTTLFTMLFTVLILIDFQIHPIYIIVVGLLSGIIAVKVKEISGMAVDLGKPRSRGYEDYFLGEGI